MWIFNYILIFSERSKRYKMGPTRATARVVFGRYDVENLVDETRHLRPRFTSTFQGDLHDQMVAHRAGYAEPQHEPDISLGEFRFDGEALGRRTRGVHPHAYQTHRACLFCRFQPGRQVFGQRQFRQVRPHLVDPIGAVGAQLQRHRGHIRGLLELERRQSRCQRFGWQRFRSGFA